MNNKYGIISAITGGISVILGSSLFGLISMGTAFLQLRSIPNDSTSNADRKNLYLSILGLLLTILCYWLYSYVF